MSLFSEIILFENEKASKKELEYSCSLINKTYNEWRKTRRRINAVDIITTTVNRIRKLSPDAIQFLSEELQMKLAIIAMRCMDNPFWRPVMDKQKVYDKLFPIINKLKSTVLNTGTGGTLQEIIMTRTSANIAMRDDSNKGKYMVCYEPSIPTSYSRYLLGDHVPDKIYKMQSLGMPEDFEELIELLKIDLKKAKRRFESSSNNK